MGSVGLFFDGPGVKEAMIEARALVGHIKKSPQAASELKRTLEFLRLPILTVLQDIVTRWWSTYTMIERLLSLQKALVHMHAQVSSTHTCMSATHGHKACIHNQRMRNAVHPQCPVH